MKKDIKKMIKVAENLGWTVSRDCGQFIFRQYSPAGRDFVIAIEISDNDSLKEIAEKIQERCELFDCSKETYLWLDNTGHGTNGAPHDMKDLYEDMEACLEMMTELRDELDRMIIMLVMD